MKGIGSAGLGALAGAGLAAAAFAAVQALMPQQAEAEAGEPQSVVWLLIANTSKPKFMEKIPMASLEECAAAGEEIQNKRFTTSTIGFKCFEGGLL